MVKTHQVQDTYFLLTPSSGRDVFGRDGTGDSRSADHCAIIRWRSWQKELVSEHLDQNEGTATAIIGTSPQASSLSIY
jgi:hypothetical protein